MFQNSNKMTVLFLCYVSRVSIGVLGMHLVLANPHRRRLCLVRDGPVDPSTVIPWDDRIGCLYDCLCVCLLVCSIYVCMRAQVFRCVSPSIPMAAQDKIPKAGDPNLVVGVDASVIV